MDIIIQYCSLQCIYHNNPTKVDMLLHVLVVLVLELRANHPHVAKFYRLYMVLWCYGALNDKTPYKNY